VARGLLARLPRATSPDCPAGHGPGRQHTGLHAFLVAAAVFVDMLLYGLIVPVVPGYARALGAGTGLIGVIFAAYAIGLVGACPLAAAATERLGARRVLIAGGMGTAASTLTWAAGGAVPVLIAARAMQGVAAAMTWTAGLALVSAGHDPSRRGQVMGWLMTAMAAGSVLGAPAGGLLADSLGYQAPFLLTTCLATAEVVAFWRLLPGGAPSRRRDKLTEHARALLARRSSRFTLLAVLGAATAVSTVEPLLPLRLHQSLHLSAGSIGLLFGLTMLAFAAASPAAGLLADRIRPDRAIAAGLVCLGVITPVLALATSVPALCLALAALGGALAVVLGPALTELGNATDAMGSGYGTSYALFNIAYAGGMLAGPVQGGLIAQAAGLQLSLVVTGCLCVAPLATLAALTAGRAH
jgi:MFS transporter, DHA1 family, solute carrier family 18 (vesicular amine transporter), member 1/2